MKRFFSGRLLTDVLLMLAIFCFVKFTPYGQNGFSWLQQKALAIPIGEETVLTSGVSAKLTSESLSLRFLDNNNKPVALSSFTGKRVFLSFWASWCGPCRAEMPSIQELYNAADTSTTAFIFVSVDKSKEKAAQFLFDNRYKLPSYRLLSPLSPPFDASSIPATYVISEKGELVYQKQGMANYNTASFRSYFGADN